MADESREELNKLSVMLTEKSSIRASRGLESCGVLKLGSRCSWDRSSGSVSELYTSPVKLIEEYQATLSVSSSFSKTPRSRSDMGSIQPW